MSTYENSLEDIVWHHAFEALGDLDIAAWERGNDAADQFPAAAHHLEHILILTKEFPALDDSTEDRAGILTTSAGHDIPQLLRG